MRWADVDLESGWWTIPATDTKNGEPHRVPLSDNVVALIRAQQKSDNDREYVFVGQGASLRDRVEGAALAAGRVMLARLREFARQRISFRSRRRSPADHLRLGSGI